MTSKSEELKELAKAILEEDLETIDKLAPNHDLNKSYTKSELNHDSLGKKAGFLSIALQTLGDYNVKMLKLLVKHGMDIDNTYSNDLTYLYLTSMHNHGSLTQRRIQQLIDAGADVNKKCRGQTPLQVAQEFNRYDSIKTLKKNGAK